jgi:hypothetical protein
VGGARVAFDALLSPHGSFLPALLGHGLADRLRGRRASANARWGFIQPPAAGGKLVWIRTGGGRTEVRLAVALARALREQRLDVRLVLTFEREHADLLEPLAGLAKTGWGYAPCDHPLAVRRALARLAPMGVICVGTSPRPHFAAALRERAHLLVVSATACDCAAERVYPATEEQAAGWPAGAPVAPRADLLTLLTVAQVDPNFASFIDGGGPLWWWHGDDPAVARTFIRRFRHELADSVLFVSGRATGALAGEPVLRLSEWARTPVAPGTLVCVDDFRWLPAVATSVAAVHLAAIDRETLWQALAGGPAPSCARVADLPAGELAAAVPGIADPAGVLRHWRECRDNPVAARAAGDSARRAFWRERRRAADVNAELLGRVFDWN